jgi:hypothetical protein
MKTIFKLAALTLMTLAVSVPCLAAPKNLERGIVGPVESNTSWSGYSVLSLIPGAGLIPPASTKTVFYLGFTAGTQADISGMVLYTMARGSLTVKAVTPITLGGVSNPTIDLASATVCPVVEISNYNPCIVRLDPTTITLSPLNDYYLAVYFTSSDSNNSALGVTEPVFAQSSLRGTFQIQNDTELTVGESLSSAPYNFTMSSFGGQADLLMYVMND